MVRVGESNRKGEFVSNRRPVRLITAPFIPTGNVEHETFHLVTSVKTLKNFNLWCEAVLFSGREYPLHHEMMRMFAFLKRPSTEKC